MLLVSGERGRAALEGLMRECGFSAVRAAGSGGEARRLFSEGGFELVLVNTPLPDEFGSALALETARESDAGVALLVNAPQADAVSAEVEDFGVFVVEKPFSRPMLFQSLRLVLASRRRMLGLQRENVRLNEKLEELRLVSRAKGALMRSTGRLYAFDVNEKRLAGMAPRMRRAGLTNVHPIAIRNEQDHRIRRLNGKFDRVLIDAPCTGTGTFRRNPDLKWRLSPEELDRINAIQKSVLEHASRLVKSGGRLVYATCSILNRENQGVVEAFLAEHPEWHLVPAKEVLESQKIVFDAKQWERFGDYFQMLPHVNNTDGFFAAVLERD